MADSAVPITAGSGTNVDTFAVTGGDHQQIVREARGTTISSISWAVSVIPQMNIIPADAGRVMTLIVNQGSSRVYLRLSGSLPFPSSSVYDWFLDPGDRWELPLPLTTYAVSAIGDQTGGTLRALLGIAS